ncbi:MAG: hypothetical protein ACRDYA_23535 [Egibacteraceae bacterium]
MDKEALERVAGLVARRNAIDAEIAAIVGRPLVAGHLGEWIASQVFDISLELSASARAIDGRFAFGPLAGRTVSIKWYGKRDGLLNVSTSPLLDYYLVMTGPPTPPGSSRGTTCPLLIAAVYLFNATRLLEALRTRGVNLGVATSVRAHLWERAEIYPRASNPELPLTPAQREALARFGG